MLIQRKIQVFGRVQGVSFRASVFKEVTKILFPIRGYIKNNLDGSVEAVFLGEEEPVLALLRYCQKGSENAVVQKMTIYEEPLADHLNIFQIEK